MSHAVAFGKLVKQAINVERAGLPSRALASTVGQAGGVLSGLPLLTLKSHVNPTDWEGATGGWNEAEISKKDRRAMALQQLAQDMERANPQELKNHTVVLGGTRLTRDIPRIMSNPRTSILGKGLGLASYPLTALTMNSMRGSHYNPFSDTTHLYGNSPATLTHELGHAIDFNSRPVPKGKGVTGWLKRQGGGLTRDAYMLSRALTPIMLYQEAAANFNSEDSLRKAYRNDPKKLNQILDERQRVLPAGMGSYLGSLAGPMGPLAGLAAGKLYGLAESAGAGGKYVSERAPKKKKKPAAKARQDDDESAEKDDEKAPARTATAEE
jgi:hypothetical protein